MIERINATSRELLPGLYSPIILYNLWSKEGRLVLMTLLSIFGTVGNSFFVSIFFVDVNFKRRGYGYSCALGISDLLITGITMPISAVVLLSGQWENVHVCLFVQTIVEVATYSQSMLYLMVGADSSGRINRTYNIWFVKFVKSNICIIYIISTALAFYGVYFDLDVTYCGRKHDGDMNYRLITAYIFHYVPILFTLLPLIYVFKKSRGLVRESVKSTRRMYQKESSIAKMNIINFVIFVISWMPQQIVVNYFPDARDGVFYPLTWFALLRAVATPILNGLFNRYFQRGFAKIIKYCCCKIQLSSEQNVRRRRRHQSRAAIGRVSNTIASSSHGSVTSDEAVTHL